MDSESKRVFDPAFILPAEIVLHPSWWHHHEGICFDEDFFYHPLKRVETERKMEKALFERWGRYGLGADRDRDLPVIGAVHLAAGFLVSEMLGCSVDYLPDCPPQVHCAQREALELDTEKPFSSRAYRLFDALVGDLRTRYGYLVGDVNWSGILNIALDLRGERIFMDFFDRPDEVKQFFSRIARVLDRFTSEIGRDTKTTSISVNRTVRIFQQPVFLHSECSNTMISTADYETFLLPFDITWSRMRRPFGVHYCGQDPDRFAGSFAKIPHLDFLDVGWGGDVQTLRKLLPNTFLNVRLSPVEILHQSPEEICTTIIRLVRDSENPYLTGICCVNMDQNVRDDQITAIFETVMSLRQEYLHLSG